MISIAVLATNPQNQTITVTRELRIGWSKTNNTYTYNWHITVTCGVGKQKKTFTLTEEQYAELYWDAVHEAEEKGAPVKTSGKTTKSQTEGGTYYTEILIATTTYQGRCVTP
jgi:hypothetical protein